MLPPSDRVVEDFEVATAEAAKKELSKSVQICAQRKIDEDATVADKTSATLAVKRRVTKECEQTGKTEYENSGGDVRDFDEAQVPYHGKRGRALLLYLDRLLFFLRSRRRPLLPPRAKARAWSNAPSSLF